MISGHATSAATKLFSSHHNSLKFSHFPSLDISVSRIGFGSFRLKNDTQHKKAFKSALLNGINLIDTSSHFGGGDSEVAIGSVLKENQDIIDRKVCKTALDSINFYRVYVFVQKPGFGLLRTKVLLLILDWCTSRETNFIQYLLHSLNIKSPNLLHE